jgi:hypothetical protein
VGGDVGVAEVERNFEPLAKLGDEGRIGVCLFAS